MRAASRLLASVKGARFLEPNSPTGLTGLFTHPAPRSALIYTYSLTLDKLKAFPESSAYRTSTEGLTQHRLSIVESVKPEGYEAWAERAKKLVSRNPETFTTWDGALTTKSTYEGRTFVTTEMQEVPDERVEEWNGEIVLPPVEGTRTTAARADQKDLGGRKTEDLKKVAWEPEPPLTADQISELENQIGAGLIEEVIQVAEGELKLVSELEKYQVWEELAEKPVEGQWTYFERDTHTKKTQAP
ncbi:MAG: hypothetical protein M1819_003317 [Sarea resinae]|nr:MAG: hypothetical protein M1819_003317 [Sarea resinae]